MNCPFHEAGKIAHCFKRDYIVVDHVMDGEEGINRRRYFYCEQNPNHSFDVENEIWNDGKGIYLTIKQAERLVQREARKAINSLAQIAQ